VPNRPPIRKMMKPRQNLRMGDPQDRAFDGEDYAWAAANVTGLSPRLAAGEP